MKRRITFVILVGLFATLLNVQIGFAQNNTYNSVLSEHTWFRLSVTQEGIYKLDYDLLEEMGIDMNRMKPDKIRLFGNPSGALPEKNAIARPDDLTEMAITVIGGDDGTFDEGDLIYFYGQEPTRWKAIDENNKTYERQRNPYSDTTFYYLCVDSNVDGMRMVQKYSEPLEFATTVIYDFPDFLWHEEELFSPYFIGQNWFGEMLSVDNPSLSIQKVFPNLVKTKPLTVKGRVYGRVSSGFMYYNVWVNDNHVVENKAIEYYKEHKYANPASFERQILLDSDTVNFEVNFRPNAQASLYLDFMEIYGWRQLIKVGDLFPFRLLPSQLGDSVSAVWVKNVVGDCWLWDVTSSMQPVAQEFYPFGDNLVFAIHEKVEKRYMLFNPSAALDIVTWTTIPNQNVHAIANVDNLILTSRFFWDQAHELADYHAERDGLNSVVVDVNEIYNEFSAGNPDPTAIRDFVRMVYYRSQGNLKYLTLFGRASADFRNIMGYNQNFVPCYETMENPHYELSFCTDDYFALMDDNEGENSMGRVDIGVGRISVSTVEEAETVLRKIRHYDDLLASHGDWKTDLLFMADDEQSSYVDNSETCYRMIDTICPSLTAKKIYCGAYPVVSTSTGTEIPGAKADLLSTLDKGVLAMLFTGHGGIRGLTSDNVFTNADIISLSNYDRMPFVYTATCEFAKYDNPLVVSAGELMILNPNGGCVALFTACRPTYGPNNLLQSKALMKVLTQRDEQGRPSRFGDIIKRAKRDLLNFSNQSNPQNNINIRFLFLGDPALRFSMPQETVTVNKINSNLVDGDHDIELHAMSLVAVEGEIRNATGTLDSEFNGTLWVKFYDKPSKVKVMFSNNSSKDVYYRKDMLYQGKVSVTNGKYNLYFQVPKDIASEYDAPRFSFYAFDSIRGFDAMGVFDDLVLGGIDPIAVGDDEGPKIDFYWNSPDFENGQAVARQGVLVADLYDAQGIYHYDYSLGRDIVLNSNASGYNCVVLNDRYEPLLNDFRRGKVTVPIYNLDKGTYEFSLKVWDTQDNSSEAHIWFVVEDDLFLSQVCNYPNPFAEETYITLKHIGEDGDFDVDIEVFDLLGHAVAHLHQKVSSVNGVIRPIRWNGCDSKGNPLRSGVYLYRLSLTDEEGYTRTVGQRMIKK